MSENKTPELTFSISTETISYGSMIRVGQQARCISRFKRIWADGFTTFPGKVVDVVGIKNINSVTYAFDAAGHAIPAADLVEIDSEDTPKPPRTPRKPEPPKYEYQEKDFDGNPSVYQLNQLGQQGWQVVSLDWHGKVLLGRRIREVAESTAIAKVENDQKEWVPKVGDSVVVVENNVFAQMWECGKYVLTEPGTVVVVNRLGSNTTHREPCFYYKTGVGECFIPIKDCRPYTPPNTPAESPEPEAVVAETQMPREETPKEWIPEPGDMVEVVRNEVNAKIDCGVDGVTKYLLPGDVLTCHTIEYTDAGTFIHYNGKKQEKYGWIPVKHCRPYTPPTEKIAETPKVENEPVWKPKRGDKLRVLRNKVNAKATDGSWKFLQPGAIIEVTNCDDDSPSVDHPGACVWYADAHSNLFWILLADCEPYVETTTPPAPVTQVIATDSPKDTPSENAWSPEPGEAVEVVENKVGAMVLDPHDKKLRKVKAGDVVVVKRPYRTGCYGPTFVYNTGVAEFSYTENQLPVKHCRPWIPKPGDMVEVVKNEVSAKIDCGVDGVTKYLIPGDVVIAHSVESTDLYYNGKKKEKYGFLPIRHCRPYNMIQPGATVHIAADNSSIDKTTEVVQAVAETPATSEEDWIPKPGDKVEILENKVNAHLTVNGLYGLVAPGAVVTVSHIHPYVYTDGYGTRFAYNTGNGMNFLPIKHCRLYTPPDESDKTVAKEVSPPAEETTDKKSIETSQVVAEISATTQESKVVTPAEVVAETPATPKEPKVEELTTTETPKETPWEPAPGDIVQVEHNGVLARICKPDGSRRWLEPGDLVEVVSVEKNRLGHLEIKYHTGKDTYLLPVANCKPHTKAVQTQKEPKVPWKPVAGEMVRVVRNATGAHLHMKVPGRPTGTCRRLVQGDFVQVEDVGSVDISYSTLGHRYCLIIEDCEPVPSDKWIPKIGESVVIGNVNCFAPHPEERGARLSVGEKIVVAHVDDNYISYYGKSATGEPEMSKFPLRDCKPQPSAV